PKVERNDGERAELSLFQWTVVRHQQGGGLARNQNEGAGLRRRHTDLVRLVHLRHGELVIGLFIELPTVIEEELHDRTLVDRAIAGGRNDDHVGPAIAVNVAEGGARGVLPPADDEHVLVRDAKSRIGPLGLDVAPADRLADVDARVKVVFGSFDRAVTWQDEVGFQIAELAQAGEDVGRAEVDAARITDDAARHDEIAEGD